MQPKQCPVCKKLLAKTHEDILDYSIQCELILECPYGHYIYEFAYGSERESVAGGEWVILEDEIPNEDDLPELTEEDRKAMENLGSSEEFISDMFKEVNRRDAERN